MKIIAGFSGYGRNFAVAKRKAEKVQTTGAPNENIVQNHLNIALLNVF